MRTLLLLITVLSLISCNQNSTALQYVEGNAFGTTYHIQFYGSSPDRVKGGIDSVVARVNQSLSTYIPGSDISRINEGDSTVVVDSLFREVFQISKGVNQKTQGYFDPTIGTLRNAYGFGEVKPLQNLDAATIDSLMQFVGFHKVRLNPDHTVHKDYPQIYFDFNAVAKGSGIDFIGRYLESRGITDFLIELGGEILAKGKNLDKGQEWVVGVETPESQLEDRSYEATVRLKDQGMASSGNYRKFRIDSLSGKKYVHTLNPLTGSAEMSDVTSATVIAPTCGLADAYATSFMALGLERSKRLLDDLEEIEAYLTFVDSTGQNQTYITHGFRKCMTE